MRDALAANCSHPPWIALRLVRGLPREALRSACPRSIAGLDSLLAPCGPARAILGALPGTTGTDVPVQIARSTNTIMMLWRRLRTSTTGSMPPGARAWMAAACRSLPPRTAAPIRSSGLSARRATTAHGFRGDTGEEMYTGGGTGDHITGLRHFATILRRGPLLHRRRRPHLGFPMPQ